MSTTINDLTSLSHLDIDHGLDKPSEAHIDNKADDVINHEALDSKYAHLGMIASVRVFKKNILICFLVLLGVIFDGFCLSVTGNLAANALFVQEFGTVVDAKGVTQLDVQHVSAWAGIQSAGQIIGMISGGFLADRLGRKFNMFSLWLLMSLTIVLELTAKNWIYFLAARLLAGWATGLIQSSLTVYLSEIAPSPIRGPIVMVYSVIYAIGGFAGTTGFQILDQTSDPWRNICYAEIGFVFIFIPGLWLAPESPWHYAYRNEHEKAKRSLRYLNGGVRGYDVEFEYAVLVHDVEKNRQPERLGSSVVWWKLFTGTDLRRTLISFFPLACQQFAGLALMLGNIAYFFSLSGIPNPFIPNVAINVTLIGSLFVASIVVDKIGRKALLLYGQGVMGLCTLLVAVLATISGNGPLKSVPGLIALACIWTIAYAVSVGPVGWVYLASTARAPLRAKTAGFAAAGTAALGLVFNYTVPLMLSPQGANWGLQSGYLWSGLTLIAGIIVYFQIPETKTRTFAELDELFDRRTSARKFAGTKTTTQETMELQRVDSV